MKPWKVAYIAARLLALYVGVRSVASLIRAGYTVYRDPSELQYVEFAAVLAQMAAAILIWYLAGSFAFGIAGETLDDRGAGEETDLVDGRNDGADEDAPTVALSRPDALAIGSALIGLWILVEGVTGSVALAVNLATGTGPFFSQIFSNPSDPPLVISRLVLELAVISVKVVIGLGLLVGSGTVARWIERARYSQTTLNDPDQ